MKCAMAMLDSTKPTLSFLFCKGGRPTGRVVMKLRSDVVPKTAENFRQVSSKAAKPSIEKEKTFQTCR